MEQIREEQLVHYEKLLNSGLDFRMDGLTWVVRSIWHLGSNVDLNKMPSFLDMQAQHFLLDVARLEIQVWDLGKELKGLV